MPGLTPDARCYITEHQLRDIDAVPTLWLRLGMVVPVQPRRIHDGQLGEFGDWLSTVTNFTPKEEAPLPWLMKTSTRFDGIITVHGRPVGVMKYDDSLEPADGCTCLLLSRDRPFGDFRPIYWYTLLVLQRLGEGPPGMRNSFRRIGIAEAVWAPNENEGFPFDLQPEVEVFIS